MSHPEPLHLQAYFDGELDTMAAVEVERHLRQCQICRLELQSLEGLRAGIRERLPLDPAPAALRLKLDELLANETGGAASHNTPAGRPAWLTRSFWMGGLSGGALVAATAAAVAWLGWVPRQQPLPDELAGAYVRSMMSTHPIDVVSSDHHTVKPWFGGHADVSPVVADFDAQGYRLIGGRADYLEHQRAAVMVYQHGAHVIDVFSWAAGSRALPPSPVARDGYHINCWRADDLNYCAISDTAWEELRAIQGLMQAQSARDTP